MSATTGFFETANSINRGDGMVWNRLHSEREDICEALLREYRPGFESSREGNEGGNEVPGRTAFWHRELLQSRLRKIDDALDRLMSGSYGNCCKCGRWIEDTKLEFDPAIAFCLDCWAHELKRLASEPSAAETRKDTSGVAIETLAPFDTIRIHTQNSEYRIFLLDPKTGRAIVQGGSHFVEPVDAIVNGSVGSDYIPKLGWIGPGCRLEMITNQGIASTSPVQSIEVDRQLAVEPQSVFESVM